MRVTPLGVSRPDTARICGAAAPLRRRLGRPTGPEGEDDAAAMSSEVGDASESGQPRWLARSPPRAPPELRSPLFGYLLDLDDDLAEEFEVRMRLLPASTPPPGCSRPRPASATFGGGSTAVGDGPGLLIVDGLMRSTPASPIARHRARSAPATCSSRPAGRRTRWSSASSIWRALRPSRLALLDADFAERVRSWPQILQCALPPRRAPVGRARRAPGDLLPAPARGPAGAAAVAPGRPLGPGRTERASGSACRSPIGCSASSSPPSARRSPTPCAALCRPGS